MLKRKQKCIFLYIVFKSINKFKCCSYPTLSKSMLIFKIIYHCKDIKYKEYYFYVIDSLTELKGSSSLSRKKPGARDPVPKFSLSDASDDEDKSHGYVSFIRNFSYRPFLHCLQTEGNF